MNGKNLHLPVPPVPIELQSKQLYPWRAQLCGGRRGRAGGRGGGRRVVGGGEGIRRRRPRPRGRREGEAGRSAGDQEILSLAASLLGERLYVPWAVLNLILSAWREGTVCI